VLMSSPVSRILDRCQSKGAGEGDLGQKLRQWEVERIEIET